MSTAERQMYPTITGVGGCLADTRLSNEGVVAKYGINSSDGAIRRLSGIEQRYHASESVLPSHLGVIAARFALENAGINSDQVEHFVLSTTTPDHLSPSTASKVHRMLGLPEATGALDINAACAGALYAYEITCGHMMAFGNAPALAVSTEMLSRAINPNDRRTAVLFGDGAGATVWQLQPDANEPVFASLTYPDFPAINVPVGIEDLPATSADPEKFFITMDGKRVKEHAMSLMPRVAILAAQKAGIYDDAAERVDPKKIDLFVPHQANYAMIEPLADLLGIEEDKRVRTVVHHGNTSSASIPLALRDAYEQGQLEPDRPSRVLMVAIGAGMVAKACVVDVRLGEQS